MVSPSDSKKRIEELTALQDMLKSITSTLELEAILDLILEAITKTLGFEFIELDLVDEEAGVVQAVRGVNISPEQIAGSRRPLDSSDIMADIVRTGKTEIIDGWDPRFNQEMFERERHADLVRIFTPLSVRGKNIGLIETGYHKARRARIEEEEVRLLRAFVDQAAIAIENARLYHSEQSKRQIAATLLAVSNVLNSTLDLEEVLHLILEQLERVIDYDSAAILFLSEDILHTVAARGLAVEEFKRFYLDVSDNVFFQEMVEKKQPVMVADIRKDVRWVVVEGTEMTRSWVGAPLLVKGKVIGQLAVHKSIPDYYHEEEAQLILGFANQAAIAIDNSRLFGEMNRALEELQTANEEQRRLLETILALSTPVVPVTDEILVVPLVGSIDTQRAQRIMETMLEGISHHQADTVIVDITGVPMVDTSVANHLLQAARAARLLGAQVILTGISPDVAQTIVELGIDLSDVVTRRSLQQGIAYAMGGK